MQTTSVNGASRQLLQELGQVRSLFATPHEALIQERSDCYAAMRETAEEEKTLSSYRDGLTLLQPAVHGLAQGMAAGHLDTLRSLGKAAEAAASGQPLAQMAVLTVRNLDTLVSGSEQDWTETAVLRLAAALGDKPANRSQELDKALGAELLQRQHVHPQPFIEGEFTAARAEALSDSMQRESEATGQRLDAVRQAMSGQERTSATLQHQLEAHWAQRREPGLLSQRLEVTRSFITHLAQADQEHPGILRAMQTLAPEQIGLSGRLFPSDVLSSYQAELRRSHGDEAKVNWTKLMGQLERTSLG